MAELKLSRKLLSAYYISALISYPLFTLIKDSINTWVTWLVSATKVTTGTNLQGNAALWFALFIVCFGLTFCIRKWIVEPLGFFINEEGATNIELWVTLFLVLGAYIYYINRVFNQPMPTEWPTWILKLLDGYKYTYTVTTVESVAESNTWVIVPWLWNISPIAFMYFNVKMKPAGK